MKRKKYIYTNRKHSLRAIMATILGIISLVSLALVVYLSYRSAGNIPAGYGMTGFLAAVFSVIGLILGMITVNDKNYFPFFPVLGILLNLVSMGCLMFLVNWGM